jgi:hypothetical protein
VRPLRPPPANRPKQAIELAVLQLTVADTARLARGLDHRGGGRVLVPSLRFRLFRQPSATAEEAIHLLSYATFVGIGGAAATFWWSSRPGTVPALDGMARTQVQASVGFTALLLAVESGFYLRAVRGRRNTLHRSAVATAS